ncbi:MAG: threonine ammonia-lyase [Rhodospirillaceae bacterium]|jgi:threonine dehydratase|nr:threonine ammonia-lyase [Rhodospirillaceae bacterium]MBT5242167.1 threonine ammonia-lyase [Rhodospirillaceae bacterium]MBT5565895.1 threonine ammonia-lyase [Rhodospirillaceae bacterium]MBT6088685.1 threonine ammonia-lyase [Rhodospirillaceae bacterium]
MTITLSDVKAAADRIKDGVVRTPCLESEGLSRRLGTTVVVKYENLQHTGAFKARGALSCLTTLTDEERSRGVVAMSAGNHAQGVAYQAQRLHAPATIVMPKGTPFVKVRKTTEYGAKVELEGDTLEEAAAHARALASDQGLTFIHPYDDADVIAGQGTIGLEMIEDDPELDVLVVPVGGGGMIAGCAVAAKGLKPSIEVIGVEPDLYPSLTNALKRGNIPCEGSTIGEGIAVRAIGATALPLIEEHVKDVVTVSETSMERAVSMFLSRDKVVAEGAGAASLAALIEHPALFAGRRVGLVLSGGNIDARMLSSVLMRDLLRLGQVLTLSIAMPDKPGQLNAVASICADLGANVLEVAHTRFAMDLSASAARLNITIETRDEAHAQLVITRLTEAGFTIRIKDPTEP